jgi:integrase
MLNSCSDSTIKQYSSHVKKWIEFCKIRNLEIWDAKLHLVLEFLSECFTKGCGYSTINSCRSALSLFLPPIDNFSVGSHPLVIRLLKGVSNAKPTRPKYDSIWDADLILNFFKSWDNNEMLSLKCLTLKLIGLLALVSGQRVQTLTNIKISNIKFSKVVEIFVDSKLKTSGPGKLQPCIVLLPYPHNDKLCVVNTLQSYMFRSLSFRKSDFLFLSIEKPHSPVTTQTVSRWLKTLLKLVDIDSAYTAHSFRHASTSKAFDAGVNIDVIFSRAGWSDGSSTFAKYYNKKIDKRNEYAMNVLN